MKKLKPVDGCQDCEATRMKPVKAWAVIRDGHLQEQSCDGMYPLLVMSTKKGALKYKYLAGDRVAQVEIREVL